MTLEKGPKEPWIIGSNDAAKYSVSQICSRIDRGARTRACRVETFLDTFETAEVSDTRDGSVRYDPSLFSTQATRGKIRARIYERAD